MFRRIVPFFIAATIALIGPRAVAEQPKTNVPVSIPTPAESNDGLNASVQPMASEEQPPAPVAAPQSTDIDAVRQELEGRPLPTSTNTDKTDEKRANSGGIDFSIFQTIAALGAVIGLILLLRYGASKLTGRSIATTRNSAVEVLGRISIAPRSHVLLVRLGRRVLAVGESPAGLCTLAQIEDGDEVAEILQTITADKPTSSSRGFAQLLGRFNGEYRAVQQVEDEGGDEQEYTVDRARDEVSSLMSRLRNLGSGDTGGKPA